jgi:branched-chain amino acid transport system substrate-binding protein
LEQIFGQSGRNHLASRDDVSYESTAEPIKIGYLMLPDGYPQDSRDDLTNPFEMIFGDAREQGLIDRPIDVVHREVEGLPKGTVKAVIDAYGELVDEGCLAIFGPHIGDNAVAIREAIIDRFRVPAISVTGSDEALSEWFFALPDGFPLR